MFRSSLLRRPAIASLAAALLIGSPTISFGQDEQQVVAAPIRLRGDQRALLAVTLERAPEHGLPSVLASGLGDAELERATRR